MHSSGVSRCERDSFGAISRFNASADRNLGANNGGSGNSEPLSLADNRVQVLDIGGERFTFEVVRGRQQQGDACSEGKVLVANVDDSQKTVGDMCGQLARRRGTWNLSDKTDACITSATEPGWFGSEKLNSGSIVGSSDVFCVASEFDPLVKDSEVSVPLVVPVCGAVVLVVAGLAVWSARGARKPRTGGLRPGSNGVGDVVGVGGVGGVVGVEVVGSRNGCGDSIIKHHVHHQMTVDEYKGRMGILSQEAAAVNLSLDYASAVESSSRLLPPRDPSRLRDVSGLERAKKDKAAILKRVESFESMFWGVNKRD